VVCRQLDHEVLAKRKLSVEECSLGKPLLQIEASTAFAPWTAGHGQTLESAVGLMRTC
jgi:hypothetical protein